MVNEGLSMPCRTLRLADLAHCKSFLFSGTGRVAYNDFTPSSRSAIPAQYLPGPLICTQHALYSKTPEVFLLTQAMEVDSHTHSE